MIVIPEHQEPARQKYSLRESVTARTVFRSFEAHSGPK
jgi:hypothetical protein